MSSIIKHTKKALRQVASLFADKSKGNKRVARPRVSLPPIAEGVPFAGLVERVTPLSVDGWCVSLEFPELLPSLVLKLGGIEMGTTVPYLRRPDVVERHGLNPICGFRFHFNKEQAEKFLREIDKGSSGEIALSIEVKGYEGSLPMQGGLQQSVRLSDIELWAEELYFHKQDTFHARFELMQSLQKESTQETAENPDEVKLIAYYLPQFHPFPENNEWWGEGFTEWSNVTAARPSFDGHYQPHLPADLGYYDLRVAEVSQRQADMAREYGIYGFCYHYYWFAGKTLMETPIKRMLETGQPDMPFCICWANESWSRRWDGSESEVLLHQPHDLETDERFIADILPYLKDPRYIRVNGAPLLIIYRISLLPDSKELFRRWRSYAAQNGVPDLHIVMAETFGLKEPYTYGCDAAVEFPPHKLEAEEISTELMTDEEKEAFQGNVFDYRDVVFKELARPFPGYLRYPCVFPSWDNTARKGLNGHMFHHASPFYYEIWLRGTLEKAKANLSEGHRFLFLNAWNEWAEGAHLEPDRKYGRAYLTATQRALSGKSSAESALEELRSSQSMEAAQRVAVAETLEKELEGLKRANRFLYKTYADGVLKNSRRNVTWIQVEEHDAMQIDWHSQDLRCNMERVNQYKLSLALPKVVLHQSMKVQYTGWIYHRKWSGTHALQAYLALLRDGKISYLAMLNYMMHRADVSSVVDDKLEVETGFEAITDSKALARANYQIAILVTNGEQWTGSQTDFSLEII